MLKLLFTARRQSRRVLTTKSTVCKRRPAGHFPLLADTSLSPSATRPATDWDSEAQRPGAPQIRTPVRSGTKMVQAQRREAAEAQRDAAKAARRHKRELRKQKTMSEMDKPTKPAAARNAFGFDGAGLEALHSESELATRSSSTFTPKRRRTRRAHTPHAPHGPTERPPARRDLLHIPSRLLPCHHHFLSRTPSLRRALAPRCHAAQNRPRRS